MDKFCIVDINVSGYKKSLVYDGDFPSTVSEFKSWVVKKQFPKLRKSLVDEFYVLSQTRIQRDDDLICEGQNYHVFPRLVGGKGGFGSMLRAIGAQIEKTTNREACRDLSGRRMRDINNEKELKDWMSKQKERDKERQRRREEKLARRKFEPQHKFEDKLYYQQREKVSQNQEDAFQQGFKRAQASATVSSQEAAKASAKKRRKVDDSLQKQWNLMGMTEDYDSSLSSDVSDDGSVTGGAQAFPSIPTVPSDAGEASTSSASADHEFCAPPLLLPIEHTTDSDSQGSASMDSMPCSTTTTTTTMMLPPSSSSSKCQKSQSSAASESSSSSSSSSHTNKEATAAAAASSSSHNTNDEEEEEHTLDLATVLEMADCADDLECLGLEKLKLALMDRGLKCGGTLADRAIRLYAVQGLSPDQIDPSFFAKPSKGKGPKKNN